MEKLCYASAGDQRNSILGECKVSDVKDYMVIPRSSLMLPLISLEET